MQPPASTLSRRKPLRPAPPPSGGSGRLALRAKATGHTVQHALSWLGQDSAFSDLRRQGDALIQLGEALKACRPEVAAEMALEVVALNNGVLTLATQQASAAARLRQIAPSLVATLKARGWRIESLRIKPRWQGSPAPRRKAIDPPPGPALEEIQRLAQTVRHPGLGAALSRLVARHRPQQPVNPSPPGLA